MPQNNNNVDLTKYATKEDIENCLKLINKLNEFNTQLMKLIEEMRSQLDSITNYL